MVSSDGSILLSPDHRDALHHASAVVLEQCFQDLIEVEARGDRVTDGFLYTCGYLPRAHGDRYDTRFLQCFAREIALVGWKLDQLAIPGIASVAEGIAAHAILREAEQFSAEQGMALDLEPIWQLLFAGTEVLTLFDPPREGMEAVHAVLGNRMTSIAFDDWFTPFNGETAHLSFPITIDRDMRFDED